MRHEKRIMKSMLVIIGLLVFHSPAEAQLNVPDSVVIIYWHNAITTKCLFEAADKYQVRIDLAPISCIVTEWYSSDSVNLHNRKVGEFYSNRLGKNWLEKMQSEISECERSTCD